LLAGLLACFEFESTKLHYRLCAKSGELRSFNGTGSWNFVSAAADDNNQPTKFNQFQTHNNSNNSK